ncbi:G1/S-specific cyclin-E1 [Polypterus senegalus]|uniref:G1/S-specific cyclin-E1 n=1 Tax=Polypterus senegalus TaxID=55291 RepID=UPI001962FC52|nr:G1/S-specific cyclin-E1 [Polypterus senegalus]XP_039619091.1 G1/S-specific cyclin-E1 [Polypterus senegalus]
MPRKCIIKENKTTAECETSKECASRSRKRKADVAIYLQDPDEEVAEMTKKKQYEILNCWNSSLGCTSPCRLIPTPDKELHEPVSVNKEHFVQYTFKNIFVTPTRSSPLPVLGWADKDDVWNNLMKKEKTYLRDRHFLERHPLLQPKMRAILLDWLMEVCEVYRLHRETFYLAQDYFDRFMATQKNVVKTRLQLIGITALFVAAKLEEIYPPKLNQFAYVTDGACTEDEILEMELIMMKELKWSLNPLTVMSWLNIYMQVAYLKDETPSDEVLIPQFPQTTFVQISKLIDLCILDVGSLDFSYGVLAASALFHFSSLELVQKVSGLSWKEIEDSVKWMVPFAMSVKEMGNTKLKCFKGIPVEDSHNIQTHSTLLGWLDKVYEYRESHLDDNRISPVPSGVLTPPQSSEKSELLKS